VPQQESSGEHQQPGEEQQLFSAELDSFNHFSNPVVAGGTVYATSWDGKLYAFGLKK